eukprot:4431913-Prymnesium_polylepis.1
MCCDGDSARLAHGAQRDTFMARTRQTVSGHVLRSAAVRAAGDHRGRWRPWGTMGDQRGRWRPWGTL